MDEQILDAEIPEGEKYSPFWRSVFKAIGVLRLAIILGIIFLGIQLKNGPMGELLDDSSMGISFDVIISFFLFFCISYYHARQGIMEIKGKYYFSPLLMGLSIFYSFIFVCILGFRLFKENLYNYEFLYVCLGFCISAILLIDDLRIRIKKA